MLITRNSIIALACLGFTLPAFGQTGWVNYVDETATRLPTPLNNPALSTTDVEEKDYAWGDVDNDGDIDLIVVRKQPFTSPGKDPNVLFMNEGFAEGHAANGVFVDRTSQYASASDVAGDQGFLTPTNDRDVVLVDVNNDGWLDMVTAVTLTDNQAKHLSHPRVYMNLGEIAGNWQGFRYEDARIPQMHPTAGPRFCSVAAGDVTGDGFADLYFGDYDSGGAQIFDFNNRLLINDGTGFFTDETATRLTPTMSDSAFGAASVIADMNGNGVADIVKQTSLNVPTHVAVTYNDPANQGVFNFYDTVYANSPYFISVGDLNGDGLLDIVVTDDGTDRYMLNQGNDASGHATFNTLTFPSIPSGAFGSNSVIADLNNDGLNDVLIADVDVDIVGCNRRMHIYRNLGGAPDVAFEEQGSVIPDALLGGTHDVAVFDINQDGWLDLVVGRCGSTEVWINQPPIGLVYSYPQGLPAFVTPDQPFDFQVQVSSFGGGSPTPGTGMLHYSVNGAPFIAVSMVDLGANLYQASLPAAACPEQISFYVSSDMTGGGTFVDPSGAPANTFNAVAAAGTNIALRDTIEGDVSAWTVINHPTLTSGAWEQADPNGTILSGQLAAPEDDATQGAANVMAFVTQNGAVGGGPGVADVDGGPTRLHTPMFDLTGTDATISYSRWFFSSDIANADELSVDISNDGGATWIRVPDHTTTGTGSAWETVSFVVSDYIASTATMQVRFTASDSINPSITEAGIDNFQVEVVLCGTPCVGDITPAGGNGTVNIDDLVAVLNAFGACPAPPATCDADITPAGGNGVVNIDDLVAVLNAFGLCP